MISIVLIVLGSQFSGFTNSDFGLTFIHFRSIFSSIYDVRLEEANTLEEPTDEVGFAHSRTGMRTPTGSRVRTASALSPPNANTPHKIDKRLTEVYVRFCGITFFALQIYLLYSLYIEIYKEWEVKTNFS